VPFPARKDVSVKKSVAFEVLATSGGACLRWEKFLDANLQPSNKKRDQKSKKRRGQY